MSQSFNFVPKFFILSLFITDMILHFLKSFLTKFATFASNLLLEIGTKDFNLLENLLIFPLFVMKHLFHLSTP